MYNELNVNVDPIDNKDKEPNYPTYDGFTPDKKYFRKLRPNLFKRISSAFTMDPNAIPYVSKKERRLQRNENKQVKNNDIVNDDTIVNDNKTNSKNILLQNNDPYKHQKIVNSVKSNLRHLPTWDSAAQYIEKRKNTPDYSDFENAKNEALKATNVGRQTANHVSANYKFDPYDYTDAANRIQAQSSAIQNVASKLSRGNANAFYNQANNLLANTSNAVGKSETEGWKANQEGRANAYKLNQAAEQFNAQSDNQADANYINAINSANMQDHNNRINALNSYAQNKYNINHAYEKELDEKRDAMVKNIANEGLNAYNNNKTNTNKKYNYWYDNNGVMHFIDGERPYEPEPEQKLDISDENIEKIKKGLSEDEQQVLDNLVELFGGNKSLARQTWMNYLKNKIVG